MSIGACHEDVKLRQLVADSAHSLAFLRGRCCGDAHSRCLIPAGEDDDSSPQVHERHAEWRALALMHARMIAHRRKVHRKCLEVWDAWLRRESCIGGGGATRGSQLKAKWLSRPFFAESHVAFRADPLKGVVLAARTRSRLPGPWRAGFGRLAAHDADCADHRRRRRLQSHLALRAPMRESAQ